MKQTPVPHGFGSTSKNHNLDIDDASRRTREASHIRPAIVLSEDPGLWNQQQKQKLHLSPDGVESQPQLDSETNPNSNSQPKSLSMGNESENKNESVKGRDLDGDTDEIDNLNLNRLSLNSNEEAFNMDKEGQIVLILCGLVGCGKSTFAKALETHYPLFKRCNQDDLGNRKAVESIVRENLRTGYSVCVDRTNFYSVQRSHWIKIAREFPNTSVWVIVFQTPYETCKERLRARTSHPTIHTPQVGLRVLAGLSREFKLPEPHEGYQRIIHLTPSSSISPTGISSGSEPAYTHTKSDVTNILCRLRDSAVVTPGIPSWVDKGKGGPRTMQNPWSTRVPASSRPLDNTWHRFNVPGNPQNIPANHTWSRPGPSSIKGSSSASWRRTNKNNVGTSPSTPDQGS